MKHILQELLNPFVLASVFIAVLLYSGIIHIQSRSPYTAALEQQAVYSLNGKLCSNPVKTSNGTWYRCSVTLYSVCSENGIESEASGKVSVFLPAEDVESLYPMKLHARLNTESMLFESGALIQCTVRWSENTQGFFVSGIQSVSFGKTLTDRLAYLRGKLRLSFKRLMCSWGSAGALILSLLSGSREYTDSETSQAFRNAGLSHILALSGMHLSFFSSLAGTSVGKLFGKRHLFVPRAGAIFLFVLFAGLSPSLLRALLCSLIMLVSQKVFCSRLSFLQVLSAVFLLHIVLRPDDCHEIAFILSYLSLAGILLLSDLIQLFLVRIFPQKLASPLAASVSAQTATGPVSLSVFSCITPVGIISTVIVSPLISMFLTLAIFAIIISLCFPFCAEILGSILNACFCCIMFFVKLFAAFPAITF